MKWENTYLVFEVSKGPKTIIETLEKYKIVLLEESKQLRICV